METLSFLSSATDTPRCSIWTNKWCIFALDNDKKISEWKGRAGRKCGPRSGQGEKIRRRTRNRTQPIQPSGSISLVWPQNYGCPQRLSYNIEQIFEYSNFCLIDKYLKIPFEILNVSDNRCMWLRSLLTQSGDKPTIERIIKWFRFQRKQK